MHRQRAWWTLLPFVRCSEPGISTSVRSRRGRTSRTSRRRGLDAVNFGPGHTAFAHHPDERVAIDALVTAYEVLGRFLTSPIGEDGG